jgi:hypothetical protein
MDDNAELKFDFKPQGTNGKGILSAKLAGLPIHTDKLDITDSNARGRFASTLCKGRKGINRKTVVEELQKLAGGCIKDVGDDRDGEKFTQSQALVNLAEGVELFHYKDIAYATISTNDHHENHPIKGKAFRQWLTRQFWLAYNKVPGVQAMQEALDLLAGNAIFKGAEKVTAVRIAEHEGRIYLDLVDDQWQAVEVTSDGWTVVADPPIKFVRRRGMLPLPIPVHGGSINELRGLVNAGDDRMWRLLVAWLVMAFHPCGPYRDSRGKW